MKKSMHQLQSGQALLSLLFFIVIAITVTSGAVIVIIANNINTTKFAQSTRAYYVAESGIENGILRLLRDPTYSGETLPVSDGTATITVSGTGPYTITAKGQVGNFIRTIQVVVSYDSSGLTITSWTEI